MENHFGAPAGNEFPQANPRQEVSLPAILLMVASALTALWGLMYVVQTVNPADLDQLYSDPALAPYRDALEQNRGFLEAMASTGKRMLIFGPIVVLNGLVFVGAWQMRQLKSRGLAIAGAIASLVPCYGTCCCLAAPIGIWALVVLFKPEVKAAFT
ncbi:hypothetical protein [Myxococcus landrumensis]|uniref:DUF4064 domain-containing protein n=1 Tax=Myxococcus landrumensis TaxID=2813577 RepID=A0ABX7NGF8_9BACT|nr:hypothetical protein [Myxococcus landrumus]QSQ17840.1 hypothetical protein JY572_18160 [Myxococcus landrumus]